MLRQTLITLFVGTTLFAYTQTSRTIDGTLNNPNNSDWGAVHVELQRLTSINYEDGMDLPGGSNWANPRTISNQIFDQQTSVPDTLGLSDFVWAFGQFIDHDITLVPEEADNWLFIQVPACDPWFDPFCSGTIQIPMLRSAAAPGTGIGSTNPRQHFNEITAFIDGSAVYGSDNHRANWLRSFQGGKMKTSDGGMLPYNTIDGEEASPIDPLAPFMADPVGYSDKHFVAGDIRANENPLLTAFHALFVREHNRLCDELANFNPSWDDEQLYQEARRRVGAYIQSIVYQEWLPAMGVHLNVYEGYDETVNPGISNVFSAAAYRLGHTLINSEILRNDEIGQTIAEGNLAMKDAFFNPQELHVAGGLEPYFRGMAAQKGQECDTKMVDDLRNFLFGPPGAGGLDLAAVNINRGRERGIPDLNTIRENFGLSAHLNFNELTQDTDLADELEAVYGTLDHLDAWVGMLAESHINQALFGETIMEIMKQQFGALRDGDSFYYVNDPAFSPHELFEIKHTKLSDIIKRNTNIEHIQDNVFLMMPFEMLCEANNPACNISGQLTYTGNGAMITDASVELKSMETSNTLASLPSEGDFHFEDLATCSSYSIEVIKDDDWQNGVTTLDLVLLNRHILGIQKLDSPYKMLAADVDMSGSISVIDMIEIQKIILHIKEGMDNVNSWHFIPTEYEFLNPEDPFLESIPDHQSVILLENNSIADLVGFKMGDLNYSANPNQLMNVDDRNLEEPLVFQIKDEILEYGANISVDFYASAFEEIEGFQFTLNYDPNALQFKEIKSKDLEGFSETNMNVKEKIGAITVSWVGKPKKLSISELFSINFVSKTNNVNLHNLLTINSRITDALAITQNLDVMNVVLEFDSAEGSMAQHAYELYQNQPNPFVGDTFIGFSLPEKTSAKLTVYDGTGAEVKTIHNDFERGYNEISINRSDLPKNGILFYKLESEFGVMSKKLAIL